MSHSKLLLIVGAGASTEVGLPAGEQLKKVISSLLDIRFDYRDQLSGDITIVNALRLHVRKPNGQPGDINPFLHVGWRIRDAMPQAMSIDNFIDAHSGDKNIELCGKLAIVRSILQAERRSTLYIEDDPTKSHLKFESLSSTWYNKFFQILVENCRLESLEQRLDLISLIIFNYDRCIEHYLYHALQNYYGIDGNRACELIARVNIYHPYGVAGYLPWQMNENAIAYGHEPSGAQLLELAHQIKTFTEGTDTSSSDIVSIRRCIAEAEIIVFLGFAFHKLNMDLINPNVGEQKNTVVHARVYATALGFSEHDCNIIENEVVRLLNSGYLTGVQIGKDLTCTEIFTEYRRGISLMS